MCHFCHQIRYTSAAWSHVLEDSQDRFGAVRAPIESLGGTIQAAFFTMDSFDVLIISEFPDNVSPSDVAVQFSAGGEVAHIHTTRLLGASEVLEAMQKTAPYSYRAIPREQALAVSAS